MRSLHPTKNNSPNSLQLEKAHTATKPSATKNKLFFKRIYWYTDQGDYREKLSKWREKQGTKDSPKYNQAVSKIRKSSRKLPSISLRLCVYAQSLQSCLTLRDPTDCSSPGFSVHGTFQARILEWVATPSSRGPSWPRDWTHISCVSCITGGFFTAELQREPHHSGCCCCCC